MFNLIGSVALAYLAGAGTTTNTAVVGRGLFRAVRRAVAGDFREAGVEALAALAAPAMMSYAATASFVIDAVDGAYDLIGTSLPDMAMGLPGHREVA
jgi:hypothetical protein